MADLILRWTFGEIKFGYNSPQGLELLKYSIKFAHLIFPGDFDNVEFYACYNNIRKSTLKTIEKFSKKYDVRLIDVSDLLLNKLRNDTSKNSWWKYALPRIDITRYEIMIDNDVILWDIPDILRQAITENALIALSDGGGRFYGDFKEEIENLDKNLVLNAGFIGFPKGYSFNLGGVFENPPKDCFFSEQGFTALNFARYKGLKYLIPLSEIQQLNINRVGVLDLLSKYKGGHFCGCNYGSEDFWDKIYRDQIISRYKQKSDSHFKKN